MYHIYFARSLKNGKVYVGKTAKQPLVRVTEHNTGSNIWSKQNGPFKLLYYETFFCEKDVSLREEFYKSGFGRKIKNAIINSLGA